MFTHDTIQSPLHCAALSDNTARPTYVELCTHLAGKDSVPDNSRESLLTSRAGERGPTYSTGERGKAS